MATPFKMKGHTLPGPNQKASPMKEPLSALALTLIGAGVSSAIGVGGSAISKGAANKAAKKKEKEDELRVKQEELSSSISGDIGSKTKIV